MKRTFVVLVIVLLFITGCSFDPNKALYDDRWDIDVISYTTVGSYEFDGIPWADNIAYPEDGNIFLAVTVSVRNKDSVYHPFGGEFGESSSLYINPSSSPIYEDKAQNEDMQPSENIDGGSAKTFVWYYEIPKNADLSKARIAVYGPEVITVNVKLN